MNVLARASAFLNRKLRAAAGWNAAYSRGSNSFTCVAVLGGTAAEQTMSDNGATIATRFRDVLIERAEFSGTFVEPRQGDLITVGTDKYIVTVRQGIGCWRYSDSEKTRMRIFVKEIK
ncbi:MAG: hypothetical protein WCV67_03085 [Victivallaceae bacterium]|jgi:hypothetical protein